MRKKTSATSKILTALKSGKSLTIKTIRSRYGLADPYQPIYMLRQAGHNITADGGRYTL